MPNFEATGVPVKDEIGFLKEKLLFLEKENADLKNALEEAESEKKKTGNAILKKEFEADKKLKSADYVYLTALKEAKFFSDGFSKIAAKENNDEKSAVIDLLKDLFKDLKVSSAKEKLKSGSGLLSGDGQKTTDDVEPFEFDLEEAINPKGELSLEELCKELGVYNG